MDDLVPKIKIEKQVVFSKDMFREVFFSTVGNNKLSEALWEEISERLSLYGKEAYSVSAPKHFNDRTIGAPTSRLKEYLDFIIHDRGLGRSDLCKALDVSTAAMSYTLNGRRSPKWMTKSLLIKKIEKALKLSKDESMKLKSLIVDALIFYKRVQFGVATAESKIMALEERATQ
jgi:hypothetical protein